MAFAKKEKHEIKQSKTMKHKWELSKVFMSACKKHAELNLAFTACNNLWKEQAFNNTEML